MIKEITTEIIIKADPKDVWAVLTDFDTYPKWNPFITSLKGEIKQGNQLTVRIEPPNGRGMTFKPIILTKIINNELSWRGKLLFNGLFDGEHKFKLIGNKDGTTTLIQSEKFSGIFASLFDTEKTMNGFNEMNQKLKELVEKNI